MAGATKGDMGIGYWLEGEEWDSLKYTECAMQLAAILGIAIDLSGMTRPLPFCCASCSIGGTTVYCEEEASPKADLSAIRLAVTKLAFKIWEITNDYQHIQSVHS